MYVRHKSGALRMVAILAAASGFAGIGGPAQAFTIGGGPDWEMHWDNTLSYNLGVRMQGIDDRIGNNPVFQESEYKFSEAGDLVTNRVALLSEFDAVYQDKLGFRVSGSAWKDFAYDDDVEYNPGNAAPAFPADFFGPGSPAVPATPYSALGSRSNGKYGSYTKRFYIQGAQLLDAFVFANFDIAGQPSSIRAGRVTQFWGNALIFGAQGINYAQNGADFIKEAAAPGTQAKELAIPRAQLLFQTALSPTLGFAAQYFFEFQGNRLPEGGTYLGPVGFLFEGPDQAFGGQLTRGDDYEPDEVNNNFGVRMAWSPEALRGTLAAYYRRLDETQPWAPLFAADGSYHLAYADKVDLLGISLDKQVGPYSTGFEVSYRKDTALNSAAGPLPSDLDGTEGARGDVLNVIANVLIGLTPTPIYQTGVALAEIAYTRKLDVNSNKALYNGVDDAGCPTGNKWDGCSTDDAVQFAGQFAPQWLQVFPGIDLDTPIFVAHGIYGNAASLGGRVAQGFTAYTAGVHALIRQKYNLTLQYNGYHGHTNGGLTNASQGLAPVGTPGFPSYYASGNGAYMYNDKGWLSLTFSTQF